MHNKTIPAVTYQNAKLHAKSNFQKARYTQELVIRGATGCRCDGKERLGS